MLHIVKAVGSCRTLLYNDDRPSSCCWTYRAEGVISSKPSVKLQWTSYLLAPATSSLLLHFPLENFFLIVNTAYNMISQRGWIAGFAPPFIDCVTCSVQYQTGEEERRRRVPIRILFIGASQKTRNYYHPQRGKFRDRKRTCHNSTEYFYSRQQPAWCTLLHAS